MKGKKRSKNEENNIKPNKTENESDIEVNDEESVDDFFVNESGDKKCSEINENDEDEESESDNKDADDSGDEIENEEENDDVDDDDDENDVEDDLDVDKSKNMNSLYSDDSDNELTIEERKIISQKKLEVMKNKIKKSGVVYLSRIPPYMKPEKLKSLLEQYGKINRMYIVPEDASAYRRRVKKGGNRNKKYVEGWIEFVDKKKAKLIAETLNNREIGGKKRSYYHDDIWNMKYLKGFKWTHLTEKIRYEKIIREQKLKAELSQKNKATSHYLINAEKDERRSKLLKKKSEEGEEIRAPKFKRKIPQKSVIDDELQPLPKKSKTDS